MKRVHIIGRKNSGKTTLIVDLVRHLSSLGHRVATIKHTHHRHELDTPGKDSHCHRLAGAAAVGILSPGLSAVFVPIDAGQSTADRYEHLYRMFPDCDLVLVEGHATATGAKVEVWRKEIPECPLAVNDQSIVGLVTDDPVDVSVPVWSRVDIPALADRVLKISAE